MPFVTRPALASVQIRMLLFPLLWALLASAMLWESDIYRYVTIAIAAYTFSQYRLEIKQVSRDWLAGLCYAWASYVILRFILGLLVYGEKGASEWLYAFPAFFPVIGAALYAGRRYIFSSATLLIVAGLIALLMTLDFEAIFRGERAAPLFHENPIHAGVGSSMLFISSLFWMLFAAETGRLKTRWKLAILTVGSLTALLSLVGILGAQSKGAWLALAASIGFMSVLTLLKQFRRWRVYILAILLLGVAVTSTIVLPYVQKVAGPTISAADDLTDDALVDPSTAMENAIADPDTPNAMRQRLMLWLNAYELIEASPIVGWGNLWLREWDNTTYQSVKHTLIHNGYLEILVRHGLFGAAFLLVFALTAAHRVNSARRDGALAASLAAYLYSITFFFFCTIATNSNNRLALGESFFILAGSAVFAITLLKSKVLRT